MAHFRIPETSRLLKVIQQLQMSSSSYRLFYLSFNNVFQKTVFTQDVTNPANSPSFYGTHDISFLLHSMLDFIFDSVGPSDFLHPSHG